MIEAFPCCLQGLVPDLLLITFNLLQYQLNNVLAIYPTGSIGNSIDERMFGMRIIDGTSLYFMKCKND